MLGVTKEDLPTDDWIVAQTRAGATRISTAWRKPWFDYKLNATRKLAFLGASTSGACPSSVPMFHHHSVGAPDARRGPPADECPLAN
jgi:hypothetical protein